MLDEFAVLRRDMGETIETIYDDLKIQIMKAILILEEWI